jgi:hypothetical protein
MGIAGKQMLIRLGNYKVVSVTRLTLRKSQLKNVHLAQINREEIKYQGTTKEQRQIN